MRREIEREYKKKPSTALRMQVGRAVWYGCSIVPRVSLTCCKGLRPGFMNYMSLLRDLNSSGKQPHYLEKEAFLSYFYSLYFSFPHLNSSFQMFQRASKSFYAFLPLSSTRPSTTVHYAYRASRYALCICFISSLFFLWPDTVCIIFPVATTTAAHTSENAYEEKEIQYKSAMEN